MGYVQYLRNQTFKFQKAGLRRTLKLKAAKCGNTKKLRQLKNGGAV